MLRRYERCDGDDDANADISTQLKIVRKGGKTEAQGEEGEASSEEAEFSEETEGGPHANQEKHITDAVSIGTAEGRRDDALFRHERGDQARLLFIVFKIEGRIGSFTRAKFINARHEKAHPNKETSDDVGIGHTEVAALMAFILRVFGHGSVCVLVCFVFGGEAILTGMSGKSRKISFLNRQGQYGFGVESDD